MIHFPSSDNGLDHLPQPPNVDPRIPGQLGMKARAKAIPLSDRNDIAIFTHISFISQRTCTVW